MDPQEQLDALKKVWPRLSVRARGTIMVAAGIVKIPADAQVILRTKKGEPSHWLPVALNILKDAEADISDRAMAKRVGVATSTLTRNELYQHAKKTYMIEVYKPVIRYGRSGKSKERKK